MDTPTLRALLERSDLQLRLHGSDGDLAPGALDRPLRWVHSSDLGDPTPFLSEGLLLLTTGTQFAADDSESESESDSESDADRDGNASGQSLYTAYVRRLRVRGVAGLGFGTEVVRHGIPPALAAACARERMPLFEVPYGTPFIAVARANAEAIAAQAYARRSWALAAQRAISLAALRPDGVGSSVAELARQLGCWVGLYDSAGSLARSHPEQTIDDALSARLAGEAAAVLRRGVRAATVLRDGGRAFTLQTLGRGGHLRGALAIASEDLDQAARSVVTSVIAMVGLALEQTHELAAARATLRAGLVQVLQSDDPALASRVARDIWGGLPAAPVTVAVVAVTERNTDAVAAFLEMHADERRGHVFFGGDEAGLVLCVEATGTALVDEVAQAFGVDVGVSDPARYDAFSGAYAQARVARDAGASARDGGGRGAEAGTGTQAGAGTGAGTDTGAGAGAGAGSVTGTGVVTRFSDIARRGVFASAGNDDARAVARATLAPLQRSDDENGTALIETARVWLHNDANGDAAARALGIHRHTVRARIALMERTLGHELHSFSARAELWAALQLANL